MKIFTAAAMLLMLACAHLRAGVEVPPRPADYLLDQAGVFSPETARRLADSLKACARDHGVHVYVMTLPTLGVSTSETLKKLEEFRKAAEREWMKGQVGSVIVFDDESGWVTMAASAEAMRRLSRVAIELVLLEPELHSASKRFSVQRVEASALLLADRLSGLKSETDREARRSGKRRVAFGAIELIGVVLGGGGLVIRKRPAGGAPEPENTAFIVCGERV